MFNRVSDITELPAAWEASVGANGELLVRIEIVSEPDAHVSASLNGETVRYAAAREAPPGCDG